MARSQLWKLTAGETVDLAKDLSADLDSDESLTGTPTVTIYDSTGTDVTSAFTLASVQVNTALITLSDGTTIAIGDGVSFRLTVTTTPGTYDVVVECDGDDGSHPASDPITLKVVGPAAQG